MKCTTERSTWTRALLFLAPLALAAGQAVGAQTPYKALYVFGDSYSDMGARYLDGNGPTVPAHLAQYMGIELTHSKDANPGGKSINFAATAASSGEDKGEGKWCCMGMLDQVNEFLARVREGKISFDPDTTLFLLEGGLNDKELTTEVIVGNITRQIELLQGTGARHFTLSLLPTRIPDWAEMGQRLNPAYKRLVEELRMKKGVDIHLNQWGTYLDEILQNPANHGIVNTTARCAGRALFKEDATPCEKPDTYFYYHGGHPSTAVNKIVAEKLHHELATLAKKPGTEG
jgi:cholinesterase